MDVFISIFPLTFTPPYSVASNTTRYYGDFKVQFGHLLSHLLPGTIGWENK